ncbi:MAG: YggS family pyridoxal phosphate-dependent enzyme [Acidimicrobiales bacterium]
MTVDPSPVARKLDLVRDRIAGAGGDPERVSVLAVTKGFGIGAPRAALAAGLADLGENYAQELIEKATALAGEAPAPAWHFIGGLQSNKVRLLADHVACWQSVDRASLVRELAKRAPGATIHIQVNATAEPQKSGCPPDEVGDLVARATEAGLVVDGLMTIGVDGDDAATARAFDSVAATVADLGLRHASMGMSADLELAVRAGSTMVRLGTALFGTRPRRSDAAVRD